MENKSCLNCIHKDRCLLRSTTIFCMLIQTGRLDEVADAQEKLDISADCTIWEENERMKHKYRVMGHVEVTISTVIESEEALSEEEIYEKADREFGGISQLVGNGGCGDRMIGVNGHHDTIMADEQPTFDDYMEEL